MVTVTYSCSLRCHLPEENKTDKELFLNNIQIIFLFWCFTKISQGSPPPKKKKKQKKKRLHLERRRCKFPANEKTHVTDDATYPCLRENADLEFLKEKLQYLTAN